MIGALFPVSTLLTILLVEQVSDTEKDINLAQFWYFQCLTESTKIYDDGYSSPLLLARVVSDECQSNRKLLVIAMSKGKNPEYRKELEVRLEKADKDLSLNTVLDHRRKKALNNDK